MVEAKVREGRPLLTGIADLLLTCRTDGWLTLTEAMAIVISKWRYTRKVNRNDRTLRRSYNLVVLHRDVPGLRIPFDCRRLLNPSSSTVQRQHARRTHWDLRYSPRMDVIGYACCT